MIKTNLITLILLFLMVRLLSAESTIMSLTESPSFLSPSVSGFVVIKSNPAGAEVFINGKSTNRITPLSDADGIREISFHIEVAKLQGF